MGFSITGFWISSLLLLLLTAIARIFFLKYELNRKIEQAKIANDHINAIRKEARERTLSFRPVCGDVLWQKIVTLSFNELEETVRRTYENWDEVRVSQAVREYRKFLYLFGITASKELHVVPLSSDTDVIWKTHILSTEAYRSDCIKLFNEILPRNEILSDVLGYGFGNEYTRNLYREHFEDPRNLPSIIHADRTVAGLTDMPWPLFWVYYCDKHPTLQHIRNYDKKSHSFIRPKREAVPGHDTRSSFFQDSTDD